MYIDAVKGSGIALAVFIIVSFFTPLQPQIKGIEFILTVSTFLFAIIAGLYLTRMNSRYDRTRETVGKEDACWLSLYQTSKLFGSQFSNTIRELIDKYYIVAYDFSDDNAYYKHNAKYFLAVYDELAKLKNKSESALQNMLNLLSQIEENRNQTHVAELEKLSMGQWSVVIVLSCIMIFSVFYMRSTELFTQITTVLLSTVLVLVVLTIRDLQHERLMGTGALVESGQEVFEFIGKLRYYPEKELKQGCMKVPETVEKYRLGLHKPGEDFKIKIVSK